MRTSVRLSDHLAGPTILPAPYAPSGLAITGSGWTEAPGTLMIYGSRRLAGLQYVVTSREIAARQIEPRGVVPSVITTQYGSYDGPDVRRLRTIAATHTVHAVTRLQQALDLQAWFRSASFRYSIKTSLPSSDWLLSFLTIDRKGDCRQFAWAYAVLARLLGIPSRIAVGYTGGAVIGAGRHEVTTADAHAWPELYFPGYGWLRFEPTPSANGQGSATLPLYAGGRPPTGNGAIRRDPAQPVSSPSPSLGKRGVASGHLAGLGGDVGVVANPGTSSGAFLAAGILLGVLLVLAAPWTTRRMVRRRRWENRF